MRAVCERGLDVDSILVITYTQRAAGELRTRIRARARRARPARPRTRARRRVDLDDPRLLPAAAEGASVRRRARPALPRARRQPGARAPRRGVRTGARGVLRGRAAGAAAPARDLRRRRAAADADRASTRRSARPGGSSCSSSASGRACRSGWRSCARRLASCSPTAARRRPRRPRPRGRSSSPRRASRPSGCSTSPASGRAGSGRPATRRRGRRSSRRRSTSSRRATATLLQELLERFADGLPGGEGARVGARLRGSPARAPATCCAGTTAIREREQLRFRSIMVDEFQDTNRLQCELVDLLSSGASDEDVFFVGDEFQSIYGFRHADVQVFRERRASAEQLLPLTRNYRSRPEVLAAVNYLFGADFGDEFQPLAASGEFPDPVFGHPVELLVTDKASYAGTGVHWRRAEARDDRAARPRARRHRRRDARRDRPPLRRRHRCGVVRGGAAGRRPADLPRHRPGLLRPAAGRRPPRPTCGCSTTATTTRRCWPCSPRRSSASRTTRSC